MSATPRVRAGSPLGVTSLIGAGLRVSLARRKARLSRRSQIAQHARRAQLAQLRGLLERAARTQIGREGDFERLLRLDDAELARAWRTALPMADYEQYRSRLAEMREQARPDVLWPGVVRDWAQTSGTTGGEKYIPVSKEMMRSNFRAAMDIFANASRFGCSLPRLYGGRMLFLGGSTALTENEHGIRTGDLSGLVTPMIRWPLTRVYTPGADIALMDHWPTKISAMAQRVVDQDVRVVSGMASWSLVLFERVLALARQRDSNIRCLRDVWPNFTLFIHGGVNYAPFDPRVREVWSGDREVDIPTRLEVYPASEGFIAMQDEPGDPGLRLNTDIGLFFEFVPLESIDDTDPRSFLCDEVEPGRRYVVVMTTCAGMWRYVIGDVVVFETVPPDGPPRLRIVGRHRHFMNAFGENLIGEQIEQAAAEAARRAEVRIGEFTAAPVYPGEGRAAGLELLVEWDNGAGATLERFRDAFDAALKAQNVDYTTKRTDGVGMGAPVITILPMGSFHRWMSARGKLGGQHKMPRCANHREILEDVVRVAGSANRQEAAEAVRGSG